MRLSLLSDGYLSDSMNDAGPGPMEQAGRPGDAVHFAALCRGIAVLIALALPIGLTLVARPAAPAPDVSARPASLAAWILSHAKSQG